MFQLLKEPNFDFMSRGKLFLGASGVLVLVSVIVLLVHGLNMGIEFSGGTELQLRFAERPDVGAIRSALQQAGMTSQVVTTIGDPADNEVYIRLGTAADAAEEEDLTSRVVRALRAGSAPAGDVLDLNVADRETLERLLRDATGLAPEQVESLAVAISEYRTETAIIHSLDELAALEGMTPEVLEFVRQRTFIGPLAVRSQSYIGPAIGAELMNKAILAIIGSLIGMLVYIGFRFEWQWGFAAVAALVHDTLVTLGLFSLLGKEMSLPVVAAFLTLVGYSVNDTVVIFDRIRENLRARTGGSIEETINRSINQTLSRTIITSGLTWIVVFALFLFGGAALNAFSFVLTVGVIAGTYSTLYIASPLLVLWKRWIAERATAPAPAPVATRRTRKVRTSSGER